MAPGFCFLNLHPAALSKWTIRSFFKNGLLWKITWRLIKASLFFILSLLFFLTVTLEDEISHAVRVLRVVESVSDLIPASSASSIAGIQFSHECNIWQMLTQGIDDLYKRLCAFSYSPALVQSFISVLGPMSAHNKSLQNWPATLVTKCDEALSAHMVPQVFVDSHSLPSHCIWGLMGLSRLARTLRKTSLQLKSSDIFSLLVKWSRCDMDTYWVCPLH